MTNEPTEGGRRQGDTDPGDGKRGERLRHFQHILQLVSDGRLTVEMGAQVLEANEAQTLLFINESIPLFDEARQASFTDPLTGALNRRGFDERMKSIHSPEDSSKKRSYGLIVTDIDHFKNFNDTYGHIVGDDTLKTFVGALATVLRPGDIVARFGGEEFIIVLPDITNEQELKEICERLRVDVENTPIVSDLLGISDPLMVTGSFGAVINFESNMTIEETLKLADKMVYKSKDKGRNATTILGLDD